MLVTCIAKKDNTVIYKVRTSNQKHVGGLIPLTAGEWQTTINDTAVESYKDEKDAEEGHEKWVMKYEKQLESEIVKGV